MSEIARFYCGSGVDQAYRTIEDIYQLPDDDLEDIHDYIQWVFPTKTKSNANSIAPVLSDDDVFKIRNSPLAISRFYKSIAMMLSFYHLDKPLQSGAYWWAAPWDHNLLRITRILESVSLILGVESSKRLFTVFALAAGDQIGGDTLKYWVSKIKDV